MRRKKNLAARLEACREYLLNVPEEKFDPSKPREKHLLSLKEIFPDNNPLHLEIGCGKGRFCTQMAKRHPDINFLAVEINQSVIVQACEKASSLRLKNLRFMRIPAETLELYLPEKSVDTIYLNFSCPFPKKRQAKRRLTHERFLEIYKKLLCENGCVRQKTDNVTLFEFSLCEFSKCGFILQDVSLNLHAKGDEDNIVTEYEKRFSDLGQPIYSLTAGLG